MTKFCCISDTHSMHDEVEIPECDFILHAGDFTNIGEVADILSFNTWAGKQKVPVICIAGNHDRSFQFDSSVKELLTNVIYLEDSTTFLRHAEKIFKVYGSPWTPWFGGEYWAFNAHRGEEIKAKWDLIPDDIDILITHGPAYGQVDYVQEQSGQLHSVGCQDLLDSIKKLKNLKLHVGGHLHLCGGKQSQKLGIQTIFVNASVCDESYAPINEPVIIEL